MTTESIIIGISIVLASIIYGWMQSKWHVKPKISRYSVNIVGRTEESESMTITFPVFVDETPTETAAKLNQAFKIREDRLTFQNQRLLAIQEEHKKGLEKARDERLKLVKENETKVEALKEATTKN